MEQKRREPPVEDLNEALPQHVEQLRQFKPLLQKHYSLAMIVHEIAALPKHAPAGEWRAIEARVESNVRAFSSIVACLEDMCRTRATGRRRSKAKAHDHLKLRARSHSGTMVEDQSRTSFVG
jgi:hypothetical protein